MYGCVWDALITLLTEYYNVRQWSGILPNIFPASEYLRMRDPQFDNRVELIILIPYLILQVRSFSTLKYQIIPRTPLDKNNSIFKHHLTSVITQFLYWLFWPFHIWFCRCYWGFFNAIRLFCIMALGLACTYWPIPFSQNGNILCRSYYYYCVHLWPAPKRNILQFSDLV